MDEIRNYHDLKVWQQAMELAPVVYRLVKQLPTEERFALGDQLRRAVVSISANIAEGQARQHTREFLHFLSVARGSLAELDTLLTIAERLEYVDSAALSEARIQIVHLRRGLYGLSSSLHRRLTMNSPV